MQAVRGVCISVALVYLQGSRVQPRPSAGSLEFFWVRHHRHYRYATVLVSPFDAKVSALHALTINQALMQQAHHRASRLPHTALA